MTHHHDHDHGHHHHCHDHHEHDHSHDDHCHDHHDHDHGDHDHSHAPHTHSQGQPGEMSFEEKMATLLDHWLKHNADHAENYREWAQKAAQNHMEDVGKLLEEMADMTMEMNRKLASAADLAKKKCK